MSFRAVIPLPIEMAIGPDDDREHESHGICADDFLRLVGETELENMQELINNEWHQLIMKAMKNDLRALQALVACIASMPYKEASGFLEVLCFHLRKPVPTATSDAKDINTVEQLAIVAVHGVGLVLGSSYGIELEDTLKPSWRAVARWLLHFNKKFIEPDPCGCRFLTYSIAYLLGYATELGSIREQVCSDPGLLTLIVCLWCDQRTRYFYADEHGYVSKALAHCGGFKSDVRELLTNMVIRRTTHSDVAALKLFDRLTDASHRLPIAWEALKYYSEALMMFSNAPPQIIAPIQLRFTINEAAYEFNDIMSDELVNAFPSPDKAAYTFACHAMTNFLTFFIYTFQQSYVDSVVGNVLTGGFLKTLIDFSPNLGQEPLKSSFCGLVAATLVETLPRHLMIYSLLEKYEKVFRFGYTQEARRKLSESPVAKEWDLFACFLEEKLAYKALFDDNQDKELRSLLCGNPDCEKVDKANNFKLCAACKLEHYCSKECQVTAWKHKGHKQACTKKASSSKRENDGDFLLYCIRRDVIRHLPGLRKRAQKRLDSVAFSAVGVGIDYTTLPVSFEVYRLQTLLDQVYGFDPGLQSRLTRLLNMSKKGLKDHLFVRATMPDGKGFSKTMHIEVSLKAADAFTVPEDERPLPEAIQKRPVGHYNGHKPLQVVAFDRVDQYLAEMSRFDPMDVDES